MRATFRVLYLILIALATPLAAQEVGAPDTRPERAGFWWGVGAGVGWASIECSYCTAGPLRAPMIQLGAGVTLSRSFALGLQLAGGGKHDAYSGPADNTGTFGDVNLSVYWYPLPGGDLWVQGGVARVLWRVTKDPTDSNTYHAIATGLTAGVGYDLPIGRALSITPSIRGVWGGKGDLVNEQTDARSEVEWRTTIVTAGIAIVWH